ncbi:MAG: polysaccharide biosynthesis C-terminal domain-containing protein [Flavobacteriales bacterium]|nr:polysaccharide biosynthesis C-terminal domain-containing protein [Flavobacteriales bacterium]
MGILARQATWNAVLAYVGMALGFVNVVLLYPKVLPEDEFGLTRLVVSIATIAAQVAQLGLDNTVLRYFPYFRDKERQHNGLLGLVLALGTGGALLAIVVLWLFHGHFALWFGAADGLYAAHGLTVLPLVLSEVYFFLFRSYSRSIHRSIAPTFSREFVLRVLQMGLIVAQAVWHFQLRTFMLLYSATFMISTLVLVVDLWRSGNLQFGSGKVRLPVRLGRSMSRYAFFTFGSGMATIALGNIDQLMVGAMLKNGLDNVAYYAVAFYIASVILIPARALVLPSMPILAEAWRKRDYAKIGMVHRRSAAIQLVIGGYLFLGLCSGADLLFSWMKPGYATGRDALIVLGVVNVINLAGGLSGGIVATSRSYWFDAMSSVVLVILDLVLNYVFILAFGMVGAAWSSLVSFTAVLLWRTIFLKQRYGIWPYDAGTLKAGGLTAALGMLLWLMPHIGDLFIDFLVRGTVITAVFWPVVHWLRIAPDLNAQLRLVVDRVRSAMAP